MKTKNSEIWSSLKQFSVDELKVKQGTWHRKCYQDATHSGMLKRAKERHEKVLAGPNESIRKTRNLQEAEPINQLTRSKTTPYNKAVCFFCDGEECNREKLREVRTMNAGKSLHEAIELSRNDKLRVKFSTVINATDARLDPDQTALRRSVKDLPPSLTALLECPKPPSKPAAALHPAFGLFSEEEIPITLSLNDYAWLLARNLTRETGSDEVQECEDLKNAVPVWSGYNSLVNDALPVTRVGAPPLIAAPAHGCSNAAHST